MTRLELKCIVSEDFTEDLLSLHDAEIQRLKQHYEDHKELFEGVHQWEESWRLYQELEVSKYEQEKETSCPALHLKLLYWNQTRAH